MIRNNYDLYIDMQTDQSLIDAVNKHLEVIDKANREFDRLLLEMSIGKMKAIEHE